MSYNVIIVACVIGIHIYVVGLFLNNAVVAVIGFTISILAALIETESIYSYISKYYNEYRYYRPYNSRSIA